MAGRDSTHSTTVIKLLIISTDCDPKAELLFSDADTPVEWNDVVHALNRSKYCLAIHRLTPPSNISTTKNSNIRNKVAFLSLQASKKSAFLYSDYAPHTNHYQITYDEKLMNDLPTFCNFKGLPRFHLFKSLPEDLQVNVLKMLDGAGFARMRCVNRRFSLLKWERCFDILRYSRPNVKVEESKKGKYLFDKTFLHRLAPAVCIFAVAYGILNNVGSGVISDEEYE